MPDVFLPYQTNLNRQRNDFKSLTSGIPALHKYDAERDLVASQNIAGPKMVNGEVGPDNNFHTNRVINFQHTADLKLQQDFNKSMLKYDMNLFVMDELMEHRNPIALPYWKGGFFTKP